MPMLAEVTCAVCNVRTRAKDSKIMPILKIPNSHLLKISGDLKDLIKHLNEDDENFSNKHNGTKKHTDSNRGSFIVSKCAQIIFV